MWLIFMDKVRFNKNSIQKVLVLSAKKIIHFVINLHYLWDKLYNVN